MAKVETDETRGSFSLTSHSEGGGMNALVVGGTTIWLDLAELNRLAIEATKLAEGFALDRIRRQGERESRKAANDALDDLVERSEGTF